MKVETKLKIVENLKAEKSSFEILLLDIKPQKNSYKGEILGLKLLDWLKLASSGLASRVVEFDNKSNILEFVRDKINIDFDYTIILLATNPLITNATIQNIMEYSSIKGVRLCKLPQGYVVQNKYLADEQNVQIDSLYSNNLDEFYQVISKAEYKVAYQILQERINSYHIDNGVEIVAPNSTYIEPFVDIDSGVKIFPHNTLKGKSKIANNVILKENNVIENSKIDESSCLSGSQIIDSVLADNVYVSAYCTIKNSLVDSDTLIGQGSCINNYRIERGSKIAPNSVLGESNDSNSGVGKSR